MGFTSARTLVGEWFVPLGAGGEAVEGDVRGEEAAAAVGVAKQSLRRCGAGGVANSRAAS